LGCKAAPPEYRIAREGSKICVGAGLPAIGLQSSPPGVSHRP